MQDDTSGAMITYFLAIETIQLITHRYDSQQSTTSGHSSSYSVILF